ncbi:hypothetical protein KIN20_016482 [Parelaphostrongylus tenuis]|uniref:Uncharacterized protein n=1 Tax=Parelaphostrongylus tenuis TaxID=148309 RepID=A0AAD5MGJ5_PARTN|nr:hypothetical protein KIN20_016482 [Parelaphostrongylus tenuis]
MLAYEIVMMLGELNANHSRLITTVETATDRTTSKSAANRNIHRKKVRCAFGGIRKASSTTCSRNPVKRYRQHFINNN